jgi:CRISPR-associated protein Cas2
MLIVSYDFTSDRRRMKFAKYLKKYGRKLQYSVYEIKNSQRILQNILKEIELIYKPYFEDSDSILIYGMCEGCKKKIKRYGYPVNEEKEVVIFNDK